MARSCDRIVHTLRQKGIRIDVVHFTPPRPGRSWQWEVRQGGEDLVCHLKLDRPHTLNLLWQHIKDRRYHAVATPVEVAITKLVLQNPEVFQAARS